MNIETRPKFTLIICSCDKYYDTWEPLFFLIKKYWTKLNAPIILNTETKSFKYEGFNIFCPQIYKNYTNPYNVPWSRRLKETLVKFVETEFVLLFLDDFFLRSKVKNDRLEICLQKMNNDNNIANITLFSCPPPFTPSVETPWLVHRSKQAPYLFNLQAGLWRTNRLTKFLRDHESPWYFERWGSIRAKRYTDNFYGVQPIRNKEAIFDYDPTKHGITKGKWKTDTKFLFIDEGIDLDITLRGEIGNNYKSTSKRNWPRTIWNIYKSLKP